MRSGHRHVSLNIYLHKGRVVLSSHPLSDEKFRSHLRGDSPATLQVAYSTNKRFCNKFFRLEKLVEIVREDHRSLQLADDLDHICREIVRRFLIHANRGALGQPFADCLSLPPFRDSDLEEFYERSYRPRDRNDFFRTEAAFLKGLRRLADSPSHFRRSAKDALAWFGVGRKQQDFRILFSSRRYQREFPEIIMPGLCMAFSLRQETADAPFSANNQRRLSEAFVEAACRAEADAHVILGKEFRGRSYRKIDIEDASLDPTVMDGQSGYLAFLMAHLFRLNGAMASPYIGFTGSIRELGQLDEVEDLSEKLQAAVVGGLQHVFVPRQSFLRLSAAEQRGFDLIHVHPFDEGENYTVAKNLLDYCNARLRQSAATADDVGSGKPPSRRSATKPDENGGVTPPVRPLTAAEPKRPRVCITDQGQR